MRFARVSRRILRLIKRPPQIAYALGLGPLIGRVVLLLTTTGRKSGQPRVTPLQYEEKGGLIYIGSARGAQADWYRNILANPRVSVRIKNRRFDGLAEPTTCVERIVAFLQLRQQRRPRMMRAMLRAEGLPANPPPEALERYAEHLALVVIRPEPQPGTDHKQRE